MSKHVFRRMTDLIGFVARGRFAERCDEHLSDALEALAAFEGAWPVPEAHQP